MKVLSYPTAYYTRAFVCKQAGGGGAHDPCGLVLMTIRMIVVPAERFAKQERHGACVALQGMNIVVRNAIQRCCQCSRSTLTVRKGRFSFSSWLGNYDELCPWFDFRNPPSQQLAMHPVAHRSECFQRASSSSRSTSSGCNLLTSNAV